MNHSPRVVAMAIVLLCTRVAAFVVVWCVGVWGGVGGGGGGGGVLLVCVKGVEGVRVCMRACALAFGCSFACALA